MALKRRTPAEIAARVARKASRASSTARRSGVTPDRMIARARALANEYGKGAEFDRIVDKVKSYIPERGASIQPILPPGANRASSSGGQGLGYLNSLPQNQLNTIQAASDARQRQIAADDERVANMKVITPTTKRPMSLQTGPIRVGATSKAGSKIAPANYGGVTTRTTAGGVTTSSRQTGSNSVRASIGSPKGATPMREIRMASTKAPAKVAATSPRPVPNPVTKSAVKPGTKPTVGDVTSRTGTSTSGLTRVVAAKPGGVSASATVAKSAPVAARPAVRPVASKSPGSYVEPKPNVAGFASAARQPVSSGSSVRNLNPNYPIEKKKKKH